MTSPETPAAEPVADARRTELPIWYGLVSDWNGPESTPQRQAFAAYMADDAQREVERAYELAQVQSYVLPPTRQAELAGHQLAFDLVDQHREAVQHMIEAPAAAEQTLALEAAPDAPDIFE